MTDTTDIEALMRDMRDLADRIVECQGENSDGEEITHLYDQSDTTFKAQNILLVLDAFEEQLQQASETNSANLNIKLALHERMVKAEKEVITLKGELLPVGEIVAWSGTDIEKGITREVDFRFLRFDVQPGQQLFTAPQKPVVLRQIGSIDHDGGEYGEYFVEFTDSASLGQAVYVIDSAIEAAGGIVKDGE